MCVKMPILLQLRIGSHQNIATISDDDDDDDLLNRLAELEIGNKVEPQIVRCEEPARMCILCDCSMNSCRISDNLNGVSSIQHFQHHVMFVIIILPPSFATSFSIILAIEFSLFFTSFSLLPRDITCTLICGVFFLK
jgi:hypothetical protein